MKAGERWNHQQSTPVTNAETKRPKLVLRDTNTVLTQGSVGGHSSYKMPPGTSRTKNFQETYNNETTTMEAK